MRQLESCCILLRYSIGVHRAVVTTLVFYRWRCWSRRPERVPEARASIVRAQPWSVVLGSWCGEVGANMYSHDSCPVPVRMLQQSTSALCMGPLGVQTLQKRQCLSQVIRSETRAGCLREKPRSPGAETELAFRAWRSIPRRREARLLYAAAAATAASVSSLDTRKERNGLLECCRPVAAFIA